MDWLRSIGAKLRQVKSLDMLLRRDYDGRPAKSTEQAEMLTMVKPDNASFDVEANLLSARFELSPLEAKFLRVLIAKRDASQADFPEASFAIRQLIYTLRKKLQKIGGVYIVNIGDGRYSIPKTSKRLIRAELGDV